MAWDVKSVSFRILQGIFGTSFLGVLFWGNPAIRWVNRHQEGQVERRQYVWRGVTIREEIDSNRDGAIDIWKIFQSGRASELHVDTNLDRRVDASCFYGADGEISTYRSDTDFDGKIDFIGPYPFKKKEPKP